MGSISVDDLWQSVKHHINQPSEKQISILGSCFIGGYITWRSMKFLSRCGNSENIVLKHCHKVLRKFLNCGLIMKITDFHSSDKYTICNYGSYGCCPKEVLQHQRQIVDTRECCNDDWYRWEVFDHWKKVVNVVSKAVGAKSENIVLVRNVTESLHCVLTWLDLKEKDAVMMSNLNYSAVGNGIRYHCEKAGAEVVVVTVTFPILSENELLNYYEEMLKKHSNIRLVVVDHISSSSALLMPIEKITKLCHKYGALVFIDGAHGPGQVQLDLDNLAADFYAGNLYKWYFAPRPSGFLWVNPNFQSTFDPTLVSHYYKRGFHDRFFKQGVSDYSSLLAAGYAVESYYPSIGGMEHLYWYNVPLLDWAVDMMTKTWGTERLEAPESMRAPFMMVVKLPSIFQKFYTTDGAGADTLMKDLANLYSVIMMPIVVQDEIMIRITVQLCSQKKDYIYAAHAVAKRAKELECMSTKA